MPQIVRFGVFEVDLRAGELRKQGLRIKLQEQPFQVLALLLQRAGEVVLREEIQKAIWPDQTFVDFDHGVNKAINKIREALGDSAENPRFIETLSRRGYRFLALGDTKSNSVTPGTQPDAVIRSIAVMPFANVANDPELEYLCDGITEDIINSLARLPEVRVMARSTVFTYKGRTFDPRVAGGELKVEAVLLGRISLRGESLTIGVELVDVHNGWLLWGEQSQRRLADLLQVKDEMAEAISEKLRLQLTGDDKKKLAKHHTTSSEAYHDYLKGRYYSNKMTREDLVNAIGFYEAAIRKDPNYALAYVGLADVYGLFGFFGGQPPRTVIPRARELAAIALNIDDDLAEGHATLGDILKAYDWNWQGAEEEYQCALRLNPNYATAHRLYAGFLTAMGRHEEAGAHIRQALELDPLSLVINMEGAWNLFMAHAFNPSVERSRKTLEIEPHFAPAQFTLGLALGQLGRHEEAIGALEKSRDSSQRNPASLAAIGHIHAVSGKHHQASQILNELVQASRRGYVSAYAMATICSGLNDNEKVLEFLRKAFRERDVWLVWLKTDPRFDGLRAEAGFSEILKQIGFPT